MSAERYIAVRLSHLLRHSSIGAIVRGPDFLMAVTDIREWQDREGRSGAEPIYYVEQVKSVLDIHQELRQPPIASKSKRGVRGVAIPAVIFPEWMRCNGCGLLHNKPFYQEQVDVPYRCDECTKPLEQYPWVLAHENGWLAEVPWHHIAHSESETNSEGKNTCAADWKTPYLKLVDKRGKRYIHCTRCGSEATVNAGAQLRFRGNQQPWLRTRPDVVEGTENAQIIEVNDSRIHSAVTKSALVIPPESRILRGSVIDLIYSSREKRENLKKTKQGMQFRSLLQRLATELRCSTAEVLQAWEDIENGYPLYGVSPTTTSLLEGEYKALSQPLPDVQDDEDFVTQHFMDEWRQYADHVATGTTASQVGKLISQVVRVSRLKEILVFTGFKRMSTENSPVVSPAIEQAADWLPALELYGEGLFFTIDESALKKWESNAQVAARARQAADRFAEANIVMDPEVEVSARFMLLHAIAHKVIKELEKRSGYPAASLKERIYSSSAETNPMAGVLIYVAVPDVVGSLGGLAEQATPAKLLTLLTRVFEDARWCSLDPVCAEHEGQGAGLLNRAACHACELLPETSCFCGNILLDRVFIKGDKQSALPCILDLVN